MTTKAYCDACGEPLDRKGGDRHVLVTITDLGPLLTTNERPLSRSYDFHRACYLASVEPTWKELDP